MSLLGMLGLGFGAGSGTGGGPGPVTLYGTPPTHLYTTEHEIINLFSSYGVDLRLDDLDASRRSEWFTQSISDATETMNGYLAQRHEPQYLKQSYWVRMRATFMAAYYLSRRRGNPSQFVDRIEEIKEEMMEVIAGRLLIPGVPHVADFAPDSQNYHIDDQSGFIIDTVEKQVVVPEISTRPSVP